MGARDEQREGSRARRVRHAGRACTCALLASVLGACGAARAGAGDATGGRAHGAAAARAGAGPSRAAAQLATAQPPCGALAAPTAAAAAGFVARRIYAQELSSAEVRSDRRQVEGYGPLLSALARGDRAAAREAVTSLVFSHTHVVRLRVVTGGKVIADVGGPDILAPVGGPLRFAGRTVGSYLLSVQDDLGYVKLETRFVGAPLILRAGSRRVPVQGTISPGALAIPASGPVSFRGRRYEVFSFRARAFPSGPLEISLLVAPPAAPGLSCSAVRVAELAEIGRRVWGRFQAISAPPAGYVNTLHGLTGALVYVRSGAHQIAGSTSPGPPRVPDSGSVRYLGADYEVRSFPARSAGAQVRVYELFAP